VQRLILASTSPYRAALLDRLCLTYEVIGSAADETAEPDEAPDRLARRLANQKAQVVAASLTSRDAIVIGADQTAALDRTLLRKPGDRATAFAQLTACRGRSVSFHTAVTIIDCRANDARHHLDTTEVRFAQRSDAELERYIDLERPLDCAGSFKAEGLGIALFESVTTRDPTAIIGLPLIWVASTLRDFGLSALLANHGTARN